MSTFGLILDILGVCILFRFGLPGAVQKATPMARNIDVIGDSRELTPEEKKEDQIQMRQEFRWAVISGIGQWSALVLIVAGFAFQIAGVNRQSTIESTYPMQEDISLCSSTYVIYDPQVCSGYN